MRKFQHAAPSQQLGDLHFLSSRRTLGTVMRRYITVWGSKGRIVIMVSELTSPYYSRAHLASGAVKCCRCVMPGRQGVRFSNAHALHALLWDARHILTGRRRGGVPRRQGLRINNADCRAPSIFLGRRQGVPGGQGMGFHNAHDRLAALRPLRQESLHRHGCRGVRT